LINPRTFSWGLGRLGLAFMGTTSAFGLLKYSTR
jgi:hypothetical protein